MSCSLICIYRSLEKIRCWKFSCEKIRVKIFSSPWATDKNFWWQIFWDGEQFASRFPLLKLLHYFQTRNLSALLMEVCERNSCVHSYHIYKNLWDAVIGEELQCERELDNESDRYAIAVKKDGTIIDHLPQKISRACSIFLRRGNSITCRVI